MGVIVRIHESTSDTKVSIFPLFQWLMMCEKLERREKEPHKVQANFHWKKTRSEESKHRNSQISTTHNIVACRLHKKRTQVVQHNMFTIEELHHSALIVGGFCEPAILIHVFMLKVSLHNKQLKLVWIDYYVVLPAGCSCEK